jgi:hypothetical protein
MPYSLLQTLRRRKDTTASAIREVILDHILSLDADETERFKRFVQRVEHLFGAMKPQERGWKFLEVALAYFMKAFQSDGLEQLLWHITALEALIGEKGGGVTDRLARRLSAILESTERKRKDIQKQFKELYEFRSDLVHGSILKEKVRVHHLANARIFTRKTLLWFLHYLHAAQSRISDNQQSAKPPSRDVLLTNLDLEGDRRQSLRGLIDTVPVGFPYVLDWME